MEIHRTGPFLTEEVEGDAAVYSVYFCQTSLQDGS